MSRLVIDNFDAATYALQVKASNTTDDLFNVSSGGAVKIAQSYGFPNDYGYGSVGKYSSERFQQVFAMDAAYQMGADGVSLSAGAANFYGIGWTHSNNTDTNGKKISGHHAIFAAAGVTGSAIGDHI